MEIYPCKKATRHKVEGLVKTRSRWRSNETLAQTNMDLGTLDCKPKLPVSWPAVCTTPLQVHLASGRGPSLLGSKRDFEGAMER